MKTKVAMFVTLFGVYFLASVTTGYEKKAGDSIKQPGRLLPMYSIVKEKGHTQIDCKASSNLITKAAGEGESSRNDVNFSCRRDENNLLPSCKITDAKQSELETSNKRVLETTLSRGFLFYFSKNRVEALANAVETANGWVTKPKHKRNTVQINANMTELKMPEIHVTGVLTTIDGFLFLKEITSSDKSGKSTTATEYKKVGDFFYPTSIQAKAIFKETAHLDVILSITDCTSK